MSPEDIVYNTCIADGLPRPLALCVLAQSQHESGNYTSAIYQDCNNSFGYKNPSSLGFGACSLHSDYVDYDTLQSSTHEITAWIYRRLSEGNFPDLNTITTPDDYAQLLKNNGYYGDTVSNYTNGLLNWYNANFIPVTIAGGGLLIVGIIAYLILRKKNVGILQKRSP